MSARRVIASLPQLGRLDAVLVAWYAPNLATIRAYLNLRWQGYARFMISSESARSVLEGLSQAPETGGAFRARAMEAISGLPGYNWSGIYRLEGNELVLDEFVGEATDHTRIPVGVGVCGTAVQEDRNQVIDDVRQLDNYLACSLQTRSEIVVLIRKEGRVLGQIDIDGYEAGSFNKSDEDFLGRVGDLIAERW